jgi:hypothetical protein
LVLDFIYEPVTDDGGMVTGIFVEGYEAKPFVRCVILRILNS